MAAYSRSEKLDCIAFCLVKTITGLIVSSAWGQCDGRRGINQQFPSFTSFSDHKKFFERRKAPVGKHEEYARYIVENTPWFEMPLKEVRDKFVVHAASKHMRFMGMPNDFEVELTIMLPDAAPPAKPFSKVKVITVNALRMSHDIEAFLSWFASYGTRIL